MKKISSIKDLPKWFNLDNYKCISSLTTDEIKIQIQIRRDMINGFEFINHTFNDNDNEILTFQYGGDDLNWKQIQQGDVILKKHKYSEKYKLSETKSKEDSIERYKNEVLNLKSSASISGVTSLMAYFHVKSLLVNKLIDEEKEHTNFKTELLEADIDIVKMKYKLQEHLSDVNIQIDLENNTDKEIVADLKKLLPMWREQLSIEEPEGILFSKQIDYEKVRPYKILPLLDLMIWELMTNQKIPLRVMTVALFPNAEKGETELKQTVIPLTKKLLSEDYRDLA